MLRLTLSPTLAGIRAQSSGLNNFMCFTNTGTPAQSSRLNNFMCFTNTRAQSSRLNNFMCFTNTGTVIRTIQCQVLYVQIRTHFKISSVLQIKFPQLILNMEWLKIKIYYIPRLNFFLNFSQTNGYTLFPKKCSFRYFSRGNF